MLTWVLWRGSVYILRLGKFIVIHLHNLSFIVFIFHSVFFFCHSSNTNENHCSNRNNGRKVVDVTTSKIKLIIVVSHNLDWTKMLLSRNSIYEFIDRATAAQQNARTYVGSSGEITALSARHVRHSMQTYKMSRKKKLKSIRARAPLQTLFSPCVNWV